MALNPRSSSKHNQMITRFIKHPKSTNFDGENDPSPKRRKVGGATQVPPTPRTKVADPDTEESEHVIKEEPEDTRTDLESALLPIKPDAEAIEEYEAFKASQEDKTEGAEERLKDRAWVRGKSSLYVDAFNLALDTVLEEENHLFDEAETEVFRIWRDLNYEAQYLYVRLFLRKTSAWHRIKNLGYHSDLSDLDAAVETLQRSRDLPTPSADVERHPGELETPAGTMLGTSFTFADRSEEEITTLDEASSLLRLDELKALAKDAKVQGKNKRELLTALRRTSQKQAGLGYVGLKRSDTESSRQSRQSRQSSVSGVATPENEVDDEELSDSANRDAHFTRKIMNETGSCIRLSLAPLKLFERVHLVFYRSTQWTEKSLTTIILAKIARRNFPEYIVSRSANVFASRALLLEYEASIRTQFRIDAILEFNGRPTEANHQEIIDTFEEIYPRWQTIVQEEQLKEDSVYHSGEGSYLRRLSPAWIYTRIIHKAMAILARRKAHAREYDVTSSLLEQRLFHHSRRGAWYQRKALLEEHYLPDLRPAEGRDAVQQKKHWKRAALATCEAGLQDPLVHVIHHYDLQKRITKLEKSLNIPKRLQHDFSHVRLSKPIDVVVHGTRIERAPPLSASSSQSTTTTPPRRPGKTIWRDPAEPGLCSVEAMCLSHYRLQGWKGFHSESGILRTLFAYLFLDILFLYVPNVFQTAYQTCPLDLHTDAFFTARSAEIHARLNDISNGAAEPIIRRVYDAHHERRTCVVGLDWSYDVTDLLEIARCFHPPALATVCKVLAQEYAQRGGGVPDLFLWRVGGGGDGGDGRAAGDEDGRGGGAVRADAGATADGKKPAGDADAGADAGDGADDGASNGVRGEVKFAEVKSENDRLSDTQRLWIHVLCGAGVRVELCAAVAREVVAG
jgi:Fanconi-associated nuclease 1